MIRQANEYDLTEIYELCAEAHAHCPYGNIPHNEREARQIFAKIILTGFAWVAEEIDGILLAYKSPLWFNSEKTGASDLIFYVRDSSKSDGVRLAKKYIEWAQDCDIINLTISFGGDFERTERFYEKLGFCRIGGKYQLMR